MPPTPSVPSIRALLEAVAESRAVLPWAVADLRSVGLVLAWDARPEASRPILEALAGRYGDVIDSDCLDHPGGGSTIAVLLRPTAGDFDPEVADAASLLRTDLLLSGDPPSPDDSLPF